MMWTMKPDVVLRVTRYRPERVESVFLEERIRDPRGIDVIRALVPTPPWDEMLIEEEWLTGYTARLVEQDEIPDHT